jgi:general stress protein 26
MTSMTLEDLSSHLKKIDFCMLSTNAGSGRITSRPMSNNGDVEYDGDSWFFCYEDSQKVADIEGIDNVSLTFTGKPSLLGTPGIFIALEGVASLIRDRSAFAAHWVPDLERWFLDGIETAGLVLIKVAAESIEYWDGDDNGEVAVADSARGPA